MEAVAKTQFPSATTRWSARALATIRLDESNQAPVLESAGTRFRQPELDVWDAWPLADAGGRPVEWRSGELWFALAAPPQADPEDRHHLARIHHFHRVGDQFTHLGQTFADGSNPGAREWSGSARLDEDGMVTLFFTAAGRRGDSELTYHQRMFMRQTRLNAGSVFAGWSAPVELFAADHVYYRAADENKGAAGTIKAFRDPAHFRDSDGSNYILFSGSSAQVPGTHDGVIGLARANRDGGYELLPPLIEATGVSNEMERAHIVRHAGRYYLFWSTQAGVFAPSVEAPTGLYGAVSDTVTGPWELLNGNGLVIANPAERPTQAYSWWVLPDLNVTSFVDYWGCAERPEGSARRAHFGGTFAPFLKLELEGRTSHIVRAG